MGGTWTCTPCPYLHYFPESRAEHEQYQILMFLVPAQRPAFFLPLSLAALFASFLQPPHHECVLVGLERNQQADL